MTMALHSYRTQADSDQALLGDAHGLYQRSRAANISHQQRLQLQQQVQYQAECLVAAGKVVEGLHLAARIKQDQGLHAEAKAELMQACQLSPNEAGLHYSLGHSLLALGQSQEAMNTFALAYELAPGQTHADAALGYCLMQMGQYTKAYGILRRLIYQRPNDAYLVQQVFTCMNQVRPDAAFEHLLEDAQFCLQLDQPNQELMEPFISQLLAHKYQQHFSIQRMTQDGLLHQLLERMLICQPELELLLRSARRLMFLDACARNDLPESWQPLLVALAKQTDLNEGLYSLADDEQALVEQLDAMLSAQLCNKELSTSELAPLLTLVSLYLPVARRADLDPLLQRQDWPAWLSPLLQPLINHQQHLQQAYSSRRLQLNPDHSLSNATSSQVQAQYETWPYPRWQALADHTVISLSQALNQWFPDYSPAPCLQQARIPVLVAGCGTGKHAINLARHFLDTQVMAIDLSGQSLGYAAAKAAEYQLDNLMFKQQDLLSLNKDQFTQKFALIECSGVLHHLAEPLAGLQALLPLLADGGLIKIGLYSHKARTAIRHLRQELAPYWQNRDLNMMRQVRDMILADRDNNAWQGLIGAADFCSVSGLKDLVFHECEHQFRPGQIQTELLDPCDLEVVGLVASASMKQSFKRTFGEQADLKDLSLWQRLEVFEPLIFAGMIQLYCQRKPAA